MKLVKQIVQMDSMMGRIGRQMIYSRLNRDKVTGEGMIERITGISRFVSLV